MSLISINDLPNEMILNVLSFLDEDINLTARVSRLWNKLSIQAGRDLIRPLHTAIKLSQIHPDPLVLKEVMEQPLPQFQNLGELRNYMLRLAHDHIFLKDVCVKLFEKDEIDAATDLIKRYPDNRIRTDTLISGCKRQSDPSIKIKIAVLIPEECKKNEMLKNIFEESVKRGDIEGALKVVSKMSEVDKNKHLHKLSLRLIDKNDTEGALEVVSKMSEVDKNKHLKKLSKTLIYENDIEGALKVVSKMSEWHKGIHWDKLSGTLTSIDMGYLQDAINVKVKISSKNMRNMVLCGSSLTLAQENNIDGPLKVEAMILDENMKNSVLHDSSLLVQKNKVCYEKILELPDKSQ